MSKNAESHVRGEDLSPGRLKRILKIQGPRNEQFDVTFCRDGKYLFKYKLIIQGLVPLVYFDSVLAVVVFELHNNNLKNKHYKKL